MNTTGPAASSLPTGGPGASTPLTPVVAGVQWLLVIAVVSAAILEVLDSTIVNIAIPHIEAAFGATNDQITWVLTSYIVASVVIMPLTGYFTTRFGRRRTILAAIGGFAFFSALCGASWSLEIMVAFRLAQGAFGALLIPLSQSILFDAFPREKRGQAMALFGLGVVVAPVLGPTIGAWLTDTFAWRMVFYVNIPVAAAALLLLSGQLPRDEGQPVRTDWTGLLLMALSIGTLQFVLDTGESREWLDDRAIQVALVVSAIAFTFFLARGWRKRDNIVDLSLFRDRNFLAACFVIMGFGISMFGSIALLPILTQGLLGFPILDAGALFIPRGIAAGVSMVLTGAVLVSRFDARLLTAIGLLLTAWSSWLYSHLALGVGFWDLAWPGVVGGLAMGLVFVPLSTLAFSRIGRDRQDEASGLYGVTRSIGSSVGIALVGALLVRRTAAHYAALGEHVTTTGEAARRYLAPLALDPASARGASVLAGEIARQAQMIAFNEVFAFVTWTSLALLPLLLLMEGPSPGGAAPAGRH